jgi:cob(I)alamin adenosyltransferase
MRIYTRTGDDGSTSLFGGRRVPKDDLRIEAYGTVDELNAFLGALADHPEVAHHPEDAALAATISADLFTLGSHLATADPAMKAHLPPLPAGRPAEFEAHMDRWTASLPELRHFILPGGHPAVSAAHICRVLSRRAERRVIALHRAEPVDPAISTYLNRLSDLFFVWSRALGARAGVPERIWQPS